MEKKEQSKLNRRGYWKKTKNILSDQQQHLDLTFNDEQFSALSHSSPLFRPLRSYPSNKTTRTETTVDRILKKTILTEQLTCIKLRSDFQQRTFCSLFRMWPFYRTPIAVPPGTSRVPMFVTIPKTIFLWHNVTILSDPDCSSSRNQSRPNISQFSTTHAVRPSGPTVMTCNRDISLTALQKCG